MFEAKTKRHWLNHFFCCRWPYSKKFWCIIERIKLLYFDTKLLPSHGVIKVITAESDNVRTLKKKHYFGHSSEINNSWPLTWDDCNLMRPMLFFGNLFSFLHEQHAKALMLELGGVSCTYWNHRPIHMQLPHHWHSTHQFWPSVPGANTLMLVQWLPIMNCYLNKNN